MQNLPARTEYRAAFCAQLPDWRIVGADYSGMELRLLAELSMDPSLLEIFDKNLDAHATIGSMLYGKTIRAPGTLGPNDPGENMDLRRHAKTLNFGISYGMGPKRLAAATGMDIHQARKLIAAFWQKFPDIKAFFDAMIQYAFKYDCAISPLDGRLRWLKNMDFDNIKDRVHAENICKNFPLQGGNASITKLALTLLRQRIQGKQIKIINTIHDEILVEAHESCAQEAKTILQDCMVEAGQKYVKRVPIIAEAYIANEWKK
jgi:DNA polymerase I